MFVVFKKSNVATKNLSSDLKAKKEEKSCSGTCTQAAVPYKIILNRMDLNFQIRDTIINRALL